MLLLCSLAVTDLEPEFRNPNSNSDTTLNIYFFEDIVSGNYINQITQTNPVMYYLTGHNVKHYHRQDCSTSVLELIPRI